MTVNTRQEFEGLSDTIKENVIHENLDYVKYLDSKVLLETAQTVEKCIKDYIDAIELIRFTTDNLLMTWYGKGKTAFEKDYTIIYQQLKDISDIMYDLYDILVDADASYVNTDESIAKAIMT